MKYITLLSTSDKHYKAYIREFKPLGIWNGQYSVSFEAYGNMDNDIRGTSGTGMKVYGTYEKALAAAKRYIKKYE